MKKINLEDLKNLVEKFYNYTVRISITEDELFCQYEDEIDRVIKDRKPVYADYIKLITRDIIYDFIFNQKAIIEQLENDYGSYSEDSFELEDIKFMYNELKEYLGIYSGYLEERS